MGTYTASIWLQCTGTHPSVLSRFASYWTPSVAAECSSLVFTPFNAPVNDVPDVNFVNALHAFVCDKFRKAIQEDLANLISDPTDIISVEAITTWSPATDTAPHEGGPSFIKVNYLDSARSQQETNWKITITGVGGTHTGYVLMYVVWRYV